MATNLVQNPGFETGNFTDWTVGGAPNTPASDNIGVDTYSGDVHTGSYGVFAGNAGQTTLTQVIPTVAGATYSLSFWLDVYQADATDGGVTASFGATRFANLVEPPETDTFTKYTALVKASSASTPLEFTFVDPPGFFGFDDVSVTQVPACYCAGTQILAERGYVPVEALAIGDRVVTADGLARPVRWIGSRSYAGRFLAGAPQVQPIRFRAGSLGGGLPHRDLLVSPEHAMYVDGLLAPASCLVNGASITREQGLRRVDYFHVELDTHDLILAEGAASETFLADAGRLMFHNAREYAALYPNAPAPRGFCARRVETGYELEAIRGRLAEVSRRIMRADAASRSAPAGPFPLTG